MFIKKIFNSKNICMFVVRTYSFPNGVFITNKAEQNKGETYGCKSRDLSELRFECVRSDLPSFIHSKSSNMRTQVECATRTQQPATAEEIITDLILSDNLLRMRCHLKEMMEAYLLDEDDRNFRNGALMTYKALDLLLVRAESLKCDKERRALR